MKPQKNISPNEKNLMEGCKIIDSHRFFGKLRGFMGISNKNVLGKGAAVTRSDGTILLNSNYAQSPGEWAYTIAHCKLHLAFGHFDLDRVPGYIRYAEDGKGTKVASFHKALWNLACDIYITGFLKDIKVGTQTVGDPLKRFPGISLKDEQTVYYYLLERGIPETEQLFGTGAPEQMDMQGLEKPIEYGGLSSWRGPSHNVYMDSFASAVTTSVTSLIREAGGHEAREAEAKKGHIARAAEWFVNCYPLLGAIASSFRIVEDYSICQQMEVEIAAVDPEEGIIYANPTQYLTNDEWRFILAHEFLHAGLMHHARVQGRNRYLWNVACDYVINGWLKEMGIGKMPEKGLLYDEKLKNLSAESVYDLLIEDLRKNEKLETFRGYGLGDILDPGQRGYGNNSAGNGVSRKRSFPDAFDGVSLDEFCRNALCQGLEYHVQNKGRGFIPAGLIEEIRALSMPPIPWDVELAEWFDLHFTPLEKKHTYARPSRRQGTTPDIPRPRYVSQEPSSLRTFGVVIDTSGSMSAEEIGKALGSIASYAEAKEVPLVRIVFCDAEAYDEGFLSPSDIGGRVEVKGRGGTVLQPAVTLLENAEDFPKDGPVLIITDGYIEKDLKVKREHAFLLPKGHRLPFGSRGKVFYFE